MAGSRGSSETTWPQTPSNEEPVQRIRSQSASPHSEQPLWLRSRTRSHSPPISERTSQSPSIPLQQSATQTPRGTSLSQGPPGPAKLRWVYPEASKACNICWRSFSFPDHRAVESETCGHIFAWSCLETWFNMPIRNHNRCPTCRERLFGWWDRDEDGSFLESVTEQEVEVSTEVEEEGVQKFDQPAETQSSFLASLLSEIRGRQAHVGTDGGK